MSATNQSQDRLAALRDVMQADGLDGWVIPIADEHMSEYVGDYAQRLAWLTGFTGSAGSAAVLADKAALFVDGRYTAQASVQVPQSLYKHIPTPEHSIASFLATHVEDGQTIGYDPWMHTQIWVLETQAKLALKGASLKAADDNLIDRIWAGKPGRPQNPIKDHPLDYAGESRADKLKIMARTVQDKGADMAVIAALDGVAWSLNLRGRDIKHSPIAFGFIILSAQGAATLFVAEDALEPKLEKALKADGVRIEAYDAFASLFADMLSTEKKLLLDPQTTVSAIFKIAQDAGATIIEGREPCTLPKACKNPVEQEGTRTAHQRDGAAMCEFLAWFDQEAPRGALDELSVADRLAQERMRVDLFQDLSFRTISAAGEHAALPHYSVTQETNIAVPTDGLYLVDSGGQYLDGTTDITRTVQVGEISDEAKRRYTQVLKGHIAVARARFPIGTPGRAIDTLARMPLWADGVDFEHGTGHGVGSYLLVHEGPQKIAKQASDEPLRPGMILSNEPGYYKEGDFGIRIENLILVQPMPRDGDERMMYGFETITLVPIDRRPILVSLLNDAEINWLNDYHERVFNALQDRVTDQTRAWLKAQTKPLSPAG